MLGLLGVVALLVGVAAWPMLGEWRWAVTGLALLFPLASAGAAIHNRTGPLGPAVATVLAVGALAWAWTGQWRAALIALLVAVLLAVVGAWL